ncbi:MAG: glycosyltransferase [Acidobacteriota bacterium]
MSSRDVTGVTVVVVAHNEEAKISACLGSLAAQDIDGTDVELILVDDGSTDRTVELARGAAPGLVVISNPSKSISSNRNRGFRAASHAYVAFIDADCEAPAHWLRTLVASLADLRAGSGALGAVGGANVPPSGETRFYDALALMLNTHLGSRGSVQGMVFDQAKKVDHLPGLNVLYVKEALEAVDGWDERFALIGEDEDLSRRLGKGGFELFYVPGAAVVHRQRANFRAWAKNMFTYGKGRVWLVRRHPEAFEFGLLIPPLLPLVLWAYLPAISVVSLWFAARAGRLGLWPHLAVLYATTHISYGFGQWKGFFTEGDGVLEDAPG